MAQTQNLPKNAKTGDCYFRLKTDNGLSKWTQLDCDLMKIKQDDLVALQYKLKNYGYDVDITGCIDKKTYEAYNQEKKYAKKRKRLERKKLREENRNNK